MPLELFEQIPPVSTKDLAELGALVFARSVSSKGAYVRLEPRRASLRAAGSKPMGADWHQSRFDRACDSRPAIGRLSQEPHWVFVSQCIRLSMNWGFCLAIAAFMPIG